MKLVMSVDRTECSTSVNAEHRKLFREYLDTIGAQYEMARGVYEGGEEQSFIIEVTQYDYVTYRAMSVMFKQECVLVVRQDGMAFLDYNDAQQRTIFIGQWQEVSKEAAMAMANYTQLGDKFFACL